MEENGENIEKSVFSKLCKKNPFIMYNGNNSKLDLNNGTNNKTLNGCYKKIKKNNDKNYNNIKNRNENEFSIKNRISRNLHISRNKEINSLDNYSFLSSIGNSSFLDSKNKKKKNINYFSFRNSISNKNTLFKKYNEGIKKKSLTNFVIRNNYHNSFNSEDKKSYYSFNQRNNNSFIYKGIKTEFNIDEEKKCIKPNPEPFPKKYNKYYKSYDNKTNYYNIDSNREESFRISKINKVCNNTECNINIDQKLLFILKNLNIEHFYEEFINNGIYFKDLFLLNKGDLIELKIPIGPRNRILFFIKAYNKSAKNYDFEELHNFFKNFNNNNKKMSNFQKYLIPHPHFNLLNKINNRKISKINIKTLNNKMKKVKIDKEKIFSFYKKEKLKEINNKKNNKNNSSYSDNRNEVENIFSKKNKPEKLNINEIGNINTIKKSHSFNLNNCYNNTYNNKSNKNVKNDDIKLKNKSYNSKMPPLPKKAKKIGFINIFMNDKSFNKKMNNNFKKEETLAEVEKRIKKNYVIFKRNREKFGNKMFNSFNEK